MSLRLITFIKELPRSRIRSLSNRIHQSIKWMIWLRKSAPRQRSYTSKIYAKIYLIVGKVVRNQAEAMSTCVYSLVTGLFNQNSQVPKISGHFSSYSPFQGTNWMMKMIWIWVMKKVARWSQRKNHPKLTVQQY